MKPKYNEDKETVEISLTEYVKLQSCRENCFYVCEWFKKMNGEDYKLPDMPFTKVLMGETAFIQFVANMRQDRHQ